MIIPVSVILETAGTESVHIHPYLYHDGRGFLLFDAKPQNMPFKKISALQILLSLQKQEYAMRNLNVADHERLKKIIIRIYIKKRSRCCLRLLSKIQNILCLNGSLTSAEIAENMLIWLIQQGPYTQPPPSPSTPLLPKKSPRQLIEKRKKNFIAGNAFLSPNPGHSSDMAEKKAPTWPAQKELSLLYPVSPLNPLVPALPEKSLKQFIGEEVKRFIADYALLTPHPQQSSGVTKSPFIEGLREQVVRNYPLKNQIELKEIQDIALGCLVKQVSSFLKNLKKAEIEILLSHFLANIQASFHIPDSYNLHDKIWQRIKKRKDQALKKDIEHFVFSFLSPYLQGKITQENDPPDRTSLLDLLYRHFANRKGFNEQIIREIALKAYIFEAVRAKDLCYRHTHYQGRRRQSTYTPWFKENLVIEILPSLQKALEKDFPCLTLKEELLKSQIYDVLKKYRLKQIKSFQKLFEQLLEINLQALLNQQALINKNRCLGYFLKNFRCWVQILKTSTETRFFVYDTKFRTIFKEGPHYYTTLIPQAHVRFDVPNHLVESPCNAELQFLGLKFFGDGDFTYFINNEGHPIPLTDLQILRVLELAQSVESQKKCLLFGADQYTPEWNLERSKFEDTLNHILYP